MYARETASIATPIGMVRVTGVKDVVESIAIVGGNGVDEMPATGAVRAAAVQLLDWFAGKRRTFDLPLAPPVTPRGLALRNGMIAIGFGETMSYGTHAASVGSSARAIGQACARNPFPIVVPCHRVLNADGALGAYSAGDGPATKSWLLTFERSISGRTLL